MNQERAQPPDLGALIRSDIATNGPITFARFMELALYHPTLGYYAGGGQGREPVGWGGDFFTAGDLTPLWGRALARRFARLWELQGRPESFEVVEAGAGRGLLAAAVWGYALEQAPGWARALRYTLVDRAPVGSALQAAREARLAQALPAAGASPERLPPDAIRWADTLADAAPVGSLVGCVFANELADALPTHLIQKQGDALAEIYVALDAAGGFVMQAGPPSSPAVAGYLDRYHIPWRRFPDGWRAEVCLLTDEWMASAARLLARGVVMTIDYGDTARRLYTPYRLAGTLMAYARHRVAADPLAQPGQQDLTAHVNFSALIAAGRAAGLHLAEYTTQGALLERLGIWDEADALEARRYPHADDRQTAQGQLDYLRRASLRNAIRALLAPDGLGGFHALTMQRGMPGLARALPLEHRLGPASFVIH